jgi:hypothetical protein
LMTIQGLVQQRFAMYSSLASASPAKRMRAMPELSRMATELSLVSEKYSPGGEATTTSWVREGGASGAERWADC